MGGLADQSTRSRRASQKDYDKLYQALTVTEDSTVLTSRLRVPVDKTIITPLEKAFSVAGRGAGAANPEEELRNKLLQFKRELETVELSGQGLSTVISHHYEPRYDWSGEVTFKDLLSVRQALWRLKEEEVKFKRGIRQKDAEDAKKEAQKSSASGEVESFLEVVGSESISEEPSSFLSVAAWRSGSDYVDQNGISRIMKWVLNVDRDGPGMRKRKPKKTSPSVKGDPSAMIMVAPEVE